jgi:hypothetical protein
LGILPFLIGKGQVMAGRNSLTNALRLPGVVRLTVAVLVSAFAVIPSGCGIATDETDNDPQPRAALPGTECLEKAGATVISTDNFGEMFVISAEAPESATRLVVGMVLETYSIDHGEEFTLPAEASVSLGAGATEKDKAIAAECATSWELAERRRDKH